MIYDYIIAGSGIAGNICAYQLSRNNKTCLILEKEADVFEKICGGGISYKAINILKNIDIDIKEMINDKVSIINGHVFFNKNGCTIKKYKSENYSIGTTRYYFDSFLLNKALSEGAVIKYNEKVTNINKENNLYLINGYKSYKFVCAAGARGINNHIPKGQSIGISAQIEGKSILKPNKFYYWYYTNNDNKYFWIFPIGKNLWNIGVWFRNPDSSMKVDFNNCIENFVKKYFKSGFKYKKTPKADFLGNIDQRNINGNHYDGIGDFAGKNNIKNGGGIIGAIESAIEYAKK